MKITVRKLCPVCRSKVKSYLYASHVRQCQLTDRDDLLFPPNATEGELRCKAERMGLSYGTSRGRIGLDTPCDGIEYQLPRKDRT
jgi:hypothetical protein